MSKSLKPIKTCNVCNGTGRIIRGFHSRCCENCDGYGKMHQNKD